MLSVMNTLTTQQLKIAEKLGRWLRRHQGHDVFRLDDDEAIIYICKTCDKTVGTNAFKGKE